MGRRTVCLVEDDRARAARASSGGAGRRELRGAELARGDFGEARLVGRRSHRTGSATACGTSLEEAMRGGQEGRGGERGRGGGGGGGDLFLDDEEEAQLQEAIRLSMSEYERSRRRSPEGFSFLLPPSSSSCPSTGLERDQQQHRVLSPSRVGEAMPSSEGGREGRGGASSASSGFFTSEEDELQQAIQASLQDILANDNSKSTRSRSPSVCSSGKTSAPGHEDEDASSSRGTRNEERKDSTTTPGGEREAGPKSFSSCSSSSSTSAACHHPPQLARNLHRSLNRDIHWYAERSPSLSFTPPQSTASELSSSSSSSSSSSYLFNSVVSPDDFSHLLLPSPSSSFSSSSSLQRKLESDVCCSPVSWHREEEEEIQTQLLWFCLSTLFHSPQSRSSSSSSPSSSSTSSSLFDSFLSSFSSSTSSPVSLQHASPKKAAPAPRTDRPSDISVACVLCGRLSSYSLPLARLGSSTTSWPTREKSSRPQPPLSPAPRQDLSSSSSVLSSRRSKTEEEEEGSEERETERSPRQAGDYQKVAVSKEEDEEGGLTEESRKERRRSERSFSRFHPDVFLYICERCLRERLSDGSGVCTASLSSQKTALKKCETEESASQTFMPRDFLSPGLEEFSSSGEDSNHRGGRTDGEEEEEEEMDFLGLLQPLRFEDAPLLATVFGSTQTRTISTEDLKRWFDHPFLFGGDSFPSFSSSSTSSSPGQSAERTKREEEREGERRGRGSPKKIPPGHPSVSCCPWGIVQLHGGPCGVLASVQSFLLSSLFFSPSRSRRARAFLDKAQQFFAEDDPAGRERFLHEHFAICSSSSSSSLLRECFLAFLKRLRDRESDAEAGGGGEGAEEEREEDSEKLGVHVREGKKRKGGRGGEEEGEEGESSSSSVSRVGGGGGGGRVAEERETARRAEERSSVPEEEEEEGKLKKEREMSVSSTSSSSSSVAIINPEFLTLRGFSSLIRRHALIEALCSILYQCTSTSSYTVAYARMTLRMRPGDVSSSSSSSACHSSQARLRCAFKSSRREREEEGEDEEEEEDPEFLLRECVQVYIQKFDNIQKVMRFYLDFYPFLVQGPSAVISFLFSVVLTRGVQRVRDDMDTGDHPLVGVYGHCSQELVNLLLLGAGTSNVWDGDKNLGKDSDTGIHAVLGGVRKRPLVGFLTEMEALRYCEVGSRYKHPMVPVWVVGSNNHYTTLFSRHLLVSHLSPPQLAQMDAQAAFRVVDEENNTYILSEQLPSLLRLLGIEEKEEEARRAIGAVDGVVLWSEFLSWYTAFLVSQVLQRNPSSASVVSPRTFTVYFHDGQTPPGPCLRRYLIKVQEDIDLQYSHPDAYDISRILWTRWPSAEVCELPLLSPTLLQFFSSSSSSPAFHEKQMTTPNCS